MHKQNSSSTFFSRKILVVIGLSLFFACDVMAGPFYLDISSSPVAGGTTNPSGLISVNPNRTMAVTAVPNSGYHFSYWQTTGSIQMLTSWLDPNATVKTHPGDATMTAVFELNSNTSTLTMGISPSAGGTVEPSSGDHLVNDGEAIRIIATANSGYSFTQWSIVGGGSIDSPSSSTTHVTIHDDATVTANFDPVLNVNLTFTVKPDASGTTQPAIGSHAVPQNSPVTIEATAAAGYHFKKWSVTGKAAVDNPDAKSTFVTAQGDATVTAKFEQDIEQFNMTMAVTPTNAGSTSPGTGSYLVNSGEPQNISANPNSGYHFTGWTNTGLVVINDPSSLNTVATLSGDATITANFAADSQSVDLRIAVSPSGSGITNPGVGEHSVEAGEVTEVEATPNSGYHFSHWTITGSGSVSNTNLLRTWVTLDGDSTLTAVFEADSTSQTLTLAVSPSGAGSTNPGVGAHTVYLGQTIAISAYPDSGYHFKSWQASGSVSIASESQYQTWVEISGDGTATAFFEANTTQATLTMAVSQSDAGSVNPGVGAHTVNVGETINIEAFPQSGYHFTGWNVTGGGVVSDVDLAFTTLLISGDTTVTAGFAPSSVSADVTMALSPNGAGSVNPGLGVHSFAVGSTIKIEATPGAGYYFSGWTVTGSASVSDQKLVVTAALISGDAIISANFALSSKTATLSVGVTPASSGTVTPTEGSHTVYQGETVEIVANAAAGYHFTGWTSSGSVRINNPDLIDTTALVSGDATVTANFAANTTPATLTMAIAPSAVSGSTNPGAGSHQLEVGGVYQVSAIAGAGYHFTNWTTTGNATIADNDLVETTVLLAGDATVTANFAENIVDVNLVMAISPLGGGAVNPGTGAYKVASGSSRTLTAIPAHGYHFVHWQIEGDASVDNPELAVSRLLTIGDSKVTAVFAQNERTAELTMRVSPDNSGTTFPGAGTHSGYVGQTVSIAAKAQDGYYFDGWSVNGSALISNETLISTTVLLGGDSTVTANFAPASTMVNLTMAVSPSDAGFVNPGQGVYSLPAGSTRHILAAPEDGYYFTHWTVSGLGVLADENLIRTTVLVAGDSTVTANFAPSATKVSLTMKVSPDSTGTSVPSLGTHSVDKNSTVVLKAIPSNGYHFVGWKSEGKASIADISLIETTALISGDATITTNFEQNTSTAILTMAVNPATVAGSTNPGAGAHSLSANATYRIKAIPANGYIFESWSVVGGASIAEPALIETTVLLNSDATVTANFAASSTTATLTMAVSPADTGSVNPGLGQHSVTVNASYAISATPASGYSFSDWLATGNVDLADPALVNTTVLIGGDATVTANFIPVSTTATLIMKVSPVDSGSVTPGAGDHDAQVGQTYEISASAASGYHFLNWTASSGAAIAAPELINTTVLVSGDASVTAVFETNSKDAILTMDISPSASGTVNPGAGRHTVSLGETISISARAETGYYFSHWDASDTAIVTEVNLLSTTVVLSDDAKVTAVFGTASSTASLTVSVSPEASGTTSPLGDLTVKVGQYYEYIAVPVKGYYFVKWVPSEHLLLTTEVLARTYGSVSGDATLVAEFAVDSKTAILTLGVTPENSGYTNPGTGTHAYQVGQTVYISAFAENGYHFLKWTLSGSGKISSTDLVSTTVLIGGDVTVTAEFAENTHPVTLTMAAIGNGDSKPAIGKHTIYAGEGQAIAAISDDNYHFEKWTITGPATISDPKLLISTVFLFGDATVTANFAPNTEQATLTMKVSPADSASTDPAIGEHTVNILQPYQIEVTPADGYYFKEWTVDGLGSIANTQLVLTTAVIVGDASITAVLAPVTTQTELTMAASPAAGGETDPSIGKKQVNVGESLQVKAIAGTDYHFVNWTVEGQCVLANDRLFETIATVNGPATLTANFATNSTPVTLLMGVTPPNSGHTIPGEGELSVNAGETFKIEASSSYGYHFVQWSIEGSGTIADPASNSTTAFINHDSAITAHFSANTSAVSLTMAVSPEESGTTNPGLGEHSVNVGESIRIIAQSSEGFFFSNWESSEHATIANSKSYDTVAVLGGESTITANFLPVSSTGTLTMSVNPEGGGSCNPGIGEHTVNLNESIKIKATAATGYYFVHWSVTSGSAELANSNNAETVVTLTANSELTAKFAQDVTKVTLTMAVDPGIAGTSTPSVGEHAVAPGEEQVVTATPVDGYDFIQWTVSGNAKITNAYSSSTTVTVNADSILTANFAEEAKTASMTLLVDGSQGGFVAPRNPSTVVIGEEVEIVAIPFDGFVFVDWSLISGNVLVSSYNANKTTIILESDSVLTAKFSPVTTGGAPRLKAHIRRDNREGVEELDRDSVQIRNAVMDLSEFDPDKDTVQVLAAGEIFEMNKENGVFTQSNGNCQYVSNDGNVELKLRLKHDRWNFKASKQLFEEDFNSEMAVVLVVNDRLFGAKYPLRERSSWNYAETRNGSPEELSRRGMNTFSVSKATGHYNDNRKQIAKINISKATMLLADGYNFDPEKDTVQIYVDNVFLPIPPGSFIQKRNGSYDYSDRDRNIKMKMDLTKGTWSFRGKKIGSSREVFTKDGISIYLVVGKAQGGVLIKAKYRNSLIYNPFKSD